MCVCARYNALPQIFNSLITKFPIGLAYIFFNYNFVTVFNAIVTFRVYSVPIFFITNVREIVIVYDKVITLIRAHSDVSHGLIMLVTHAALPLIQQRIHIARPWAALIFPRRTVFWLWHAESEQRKIPAPAVNSAYFVLFRQDDGHVCSAEELCRDESLGVGTAVARD